MIDTKEYGKMEIIFYHIVPGNGKAHIDSRYGVDCIWVEYTFMLKLFLQQFILERNYSDVTDPIHTEIFTEITIHDKRQKNEFRWVCVIIIYAGIMGNKVFCLK